MSYSPLKGVVPSIRDRGMFRTGLKKTEEPEARGLAGEGGEFDKSPLCGESQ